MPPTTAVTMPDLGSQPAQATVGRWIKRVGERVVAGEPLVELTTDRGRIEVVALADGVLTAIHLPEGSAVPPGGELACLSDAVPSAPADTEPAAEQPPAAASATGTVRTTPLGRRLAAEYAVDLARVRGTGSGGRITSHDVAEWLKGAPAARAAVAPPGTVRVQERDADPRTSPQPATTAPSAPRSPAVRPAMIASPAQRQDGEPAASHAPTAWMLVEADLTELLAGFRAQSKASGARTALSASILRATARALREQPLLNAAWAGDAIHLYHGITIAFIEATGGQTTIIHEVDRLSLNELAAAARARAGPATASMSAPTFTVVEAAVGDAGVLTRLPLPPAQAACLVVGPPLRRLMVVDDQLALRSIASLGLIFDHRVLDGAPAGRFLHTVRRFLEAGFDGRHTVSYNTVRPIEVPPRGTAGGAR